MADSAAVVDAVDVLMPVHVVVVAVVGVALKGTSGRFLLARYSWEANSLLWTPV